MRYKYKLTNMPMQLQFLSLTHVKSYLLIAAGTKEKNKNEKPKHLH